MEEMKNRICLIITAIPERFPFPFFNENESVNDFRIILTLFSFLCHANFFKNNNKVNEFFFNHSKYSK